MDWLQSTHPQVNSFWVAGFSFGAWIAMQLLMRRPELEGFIDLSPPTNMYDFNFDAFGKAFANKTRTRNVKYGEPLVPSGKVL